MTKRLIIPKNAEQEIILCFYDYFFNPRDEKNVNELYNKYVLM